MKNEITDSSLILVFSRNTSRIARKWDDTSQKMVKDERWVPWWVEKYSANFIDLVNVQSKFLLRRNWGPVSTYEVTTLNVEKRDTGALSVHMPLLHLLTVLRQWNSFFLFVNRPNEGQLEEISQSYWRFTAALTLFFTLLFVTTVHLDVFREIATL